MAKIKSGTSKKVNDRLQCQRLLKKARIDVHVPRSSEVWKHSEDIQYVCVFEKEQCIQAYLTAKNKYGKTLTPYIFWDVAQQRAFRKKYRVERFLSEATGEDQYQLILKMQKYYHRLKKEGRF